jgi:hypothetical protein
MYLRIMSFPKFTIFDVQGSGDRLQIFGSISGVQYGRETWIGDQYVGYLFRKKPLAFGRWHAVGQRWKFSTEGLLVSKLPSPGDAVEVLDGYWGERAELIFNENASWTIARYSQPDDHEHCFICWATISKLSNVEHMRWTKHTSVCMSCYNEYVKRRSLDFITFNP